MGKTRATRTAFQPAGYTVFTLSAARMTATGSIQRLMMWCPPAMTIPIITRTRIRVNIDQTSPSCLNHGIAVHRVSPNWPSVWM